MFVASIYFGTVITRLNESYKIANNPLGAVTRLRNRAEKYATLENDLDYEMEIVTRLALRIQQARDDRLQAARDNWTPEEVERHKSRMTLGKHHITWS
ncbi:hypothetical protein SAMN05216360_12231 [Methylobacterium phyllostachyos]|uniref:Uncharacterized protein n=2 Tax=Methylobacterium phyllostachyos TaxID=582672 RepID=A0A1H0JDN4_9HYPH|nr:hypothetical protein SAMN05216360_12231 [Methylobacterium phyllostachyos]